jgi:hypothetical protein
MAWRGDAAGSVAVPAREAPHRDDRGAALPTNVQTTPVAQLRDDNSHDLSGPLGPVQGPARGFVEPPRAGVAWHDSQYRVEKAALASEPSPSSKPSTTASPSNHLPPDPPGIHL